MRAVLSPPPAPAPLIKKMVQSTPGPELRYQHTTDALHCYSWALCSATHPLLQQHTRISRVRQ